MLTDPRWLRGERAWLGREAIVDTVDRASLSDILRNLEGCSDLGTLGHRAQPHKNALLVAEAEWRAAIAALTTLLPTFPRQTASPLHGATLPEGVAISGPLPVLNQADFGQRIETWVVTPQPLAEALTGQRTLLPAGAEVIPMLSRKTFQVLPLRLETPLVAERFCLVMTPMLTVALVLGQPTGESPCLQYSFDPQVVLTLWQHIRGQIAETVGPRVERLNQRLAGAIAAPDYRVITRFTQAMMAHLPHRLSKAPLTLEDRGPLRLSTVGAESPLPHAGNGHHPALGSPLLAATGGDAAMTARAADTELLRAMAHEIRTPLTTIRTLTRSLLRRADVSAEVQKRLARIDQECTQQIDRFNLIFRAVELETMGRDRPRSSLTPIALTQIFNDAIPRWQKQAERRNLKLEVTLPPHLPRVTSDPTLLNEVLTGVVEWFTQCLPPQSHVHMHVMLAGHQLKLQFESEPTTPPCPSQGAANAKRQKLKSVGQLLTIVPETGGVSLNLDVTKSLFQFLGGKLIVRQRPDQGEVLTAFLPLDTREI
ncbi:MAG TPA: HAMP domain-containing sensor histidine kinase [Candidatus Obscuribacterales bacterium]